VENPLYERSESDKKGDLQLGDAYCTLPWLELSMIFILFVPASQLSLLQEGLPSKRVAMLRGPYGSLKSLHV
jgi:hypothetical protein